MLKDEEYAQGLWEFDTTAPIEMQFNRWHLVNYTNKNFGDVEIHLALGAAPFFTQALISKDPLDERVFFPVFQNGISIVSLAFTESAFASRKFAVRVYEYLHSRDKHFWKTVTPVPDKGLSLIHILATMVELKEKHKVSS